MTEKNPMKKRFLILTTLILLNLAACQGESQPDNTQESVTATAAVTRVIPNISGPEPSCTVSSPQPTPGPTEQTLFPPVNETDWALGPETASLTILEYGDFQ